MLANADLVTMWGLTLVGLFLILGLFTRLASLAGIGFILLFYLATPPFIGYFYSIPSEGSYLIVNKNLVELCALVVILVTRSGLFAGLDRIVHGLIARRPTARRGLIRKEIRHERGRRTPPSRSVCFTYSGRGRSPWLNRSRAWRTSHWTCLLQSRQCAAAGWYSDRLASVDVCGTFAKFFLPVGKIPRKEA